MRASLGLVVALILAVGLRGEVREPQSTAPTVDELRKAGREVVPPKLIKNFLPDFPEKLRKKKLNGTVIVTFIVDESGIPQDLKVKSSSDRRFEALALEAVRQWRFEPALVDRQPAAVSTSAEVNFRLY
jgi:protein TonB